MNPFTTVARQRRAEGAIALARRIETEGRIARKLVQHALASGYAVSVYDGEAWALKRSRKLADIMGALFSTDDDTLVFRDAEGARVGSVNLVYGNDGYDVISDYGAPDLDAFTVWMRPIDEYAEAQEA